MRFIKSLLRKTDIQTSHHSNHTIPPIENLIIQLSNHHTKIILKSIELRNINIYIWSTRIGFTRDKEVVRYSISTTPPFEIINSASCSFKSGPCMTFNTRASALPFLTQSRIVEA